MADVPKQVRDNLLKECEQYYLINDPSKNYRMDRLEICGVEVREGEGESWAPFYKEDKSE